MIISTGLASEADLAEAVAAARGAGAREIVLLHCTSGYPTPAAQMHLKTMRHLAESTGALVGLSDHTLGTAVAVAAVALGASVIEKHFTLARADGGPDSAFSLEPDELASLVADCRAAWEALGEVHYGEVEAEAASRAHRRSLYVIADVRRGEALTPANVRSIRPGHGLPPKHLPQVIGRLAARDLKRGEPLAWDSVA
jgi:N-acetylneuraminate synthase